MKDVNAHICPNCGGKLSVDIGRQMYECPFCGVTFDYDYFREESVLGIASQALMNSEFDSADRAYDFMLEKEPDNFEALRGKALAALKMTKIEDIRSLDHYSKINYESACKELDRGIGSSKPQDREYFTVMKDIVEAGCEYVDKKAVLETQRTKRKSAIEDLNEVVEERDTIYIYSSPRFRRKKAVILTIVCYLICCLAIILGYKYANRNPYAEAEDLSQYETVQTDRTDHSSGSDSSEWQINNVKYKEALEREEQRKINYDTWEKNHDDSNTNLIWLLGYATVFFAVVVLVLFLRGRSLDAEVSRIQTKTDEQTDMIRTCRERMNELQERIEQGYQRLCELHPDKG